MDRVINKLNPIGENWIKKFLASHPGQTKFSTTKVFYWIVDNHGPSMSNTAIWKWLLKHGSSVTDYKESFVKNCLSKGR